MEKRNPREQVKQLTEQLEKGIKDLYTSDKYKEVLLCMSKFHHYSYRNVLLIKLQDPNASRVAGFNTWKNDFERSVMKGETAIKILAPNPYKRMIEYKKLDPATLNPILDKNGKTVMEKREEKMMMYKVVSVFDVSQTKGKELPSLVTPLTKDVKNYKQFMKALHTVSTVPIIYQDLTGGANGHYDFVDKEIVVKDGMSESATASTTVHEMAHSILHDRNTTKLSDEDLQNRGKYEVEAESVSFVVCNYFGIKTDEKSFGYVTGWSEGKELQELKESLDVIQKTSSELIKKIEIEFDKNLDLQHRKENIKVVDRKGR